MGAIAPVSTINRMVIRGLNIILLMSTGVIAAEVCIFAPVSVEVCIFAPVSALFKQPTQPYVGFWNNDPGNILFSLV